MYIENTTSTAKGLLNAASQLIASLFYIELATIPCFYASVETCLVVIRCRLPPGEALEDLACMLFRQNVSIYIWTETSAHTAFLSTEHIVQAAKQGCAYYQEFPLEVVSFKSTINVQIDGMDGLRHNLSGCPYILDDLIADQGLDCKFGFGSYTQNLASSSVLGAKIPENDQLMGILDTF